ncbi:MAG: GntR family transcriptional regulator [Pseudomonadota bacterium]
MSSAIDKAYEAIKKNIMSGEFGPGFQLKEVQLAEDLGISRTPIKHAIIRLVDEGLAVTQPNRRTYVAELGAEQFSQIFDVLVWLEGYSAGQAATRIDAESLAHLKSLNAEMATCDPDVPAERARFMALNTEWHIAIHEASGNKRIASMIRSLIEITRFLLVKHGELNRGQVRNAISEHDEIVAALESGSVELATLRMRLHRAAVRGSFEALWAELEQDAELPTIVSATGR